MGFRNLQESDRGLITLYQVGVTGEAFAARCLFARIQKAPAAPGAAAQP